MWLTIKGCGKILRTSFNFFFLLHDGQGSSLQTYCRPYAMLPGLDLDSKHDSVLLGIDYLFAQA